MLRPGRPPQQGPSPATSAGNGAGGGAGGVDETVEVAGVARQHAIAVTGEERDVGVDDIARARCGAQHPDLAGLTSIEGLFAEPGQKAGQERLAGAVSQSLGDTARGCDEPVLAAPRGLDERGDLAIAPFEGDQGAGIEDDPHRLRPPRAAAATAVAVSGRWTG